MTTPSRPEIGFIGLGAMGQPMALNLIKAGYALHVYDIAADRSAACQELGARTASGPADAARQSDIVFTSLPDSAVSVQVTERDLLPVARCGQLFIGLGTVMPHEIERLAALFSAKGASLLDVPVSGGVGGAQTGKLRMFAGGNEADFERAYPVLQVLGDPDFIVYCGPSGNGQRVKFVNQMAAGLSTAAYLESLALGVKAGIAPDMLAQAIGGDAGWRAGFRSVAEKAARGDAVHMGVKFGQLSYFVETARQMGLDLPLAQALYTFCESGERLITEANRQSPSFWHELMSRSPD